MGYASYLEDIRDRFHEQMREIAAVVKSSTNSDETRRRAQALLDACKQVIADIERHLELATDPEVELAHEVAELLAQQAHLRTSVSALYQEKKDLLAARQQIEAEKRALEQERKQLKKEIRRQQEEFDALVGQNQAAAIDLYSSPEKIRKLKPNA